MDPHAVKKTRKKEGPFNESLTGSHTLDFELMKSFFEAVQKGDEAAVRWYLGALKASGIAAAEFEKRIRIQYKIPVLQQAVAGGHSGIIEILLAAGIDATGRVSPDEKGNWAGREAIHCIGFAPWRDVNSALWAVHILKDYGADLNVKCVNGDTPLHIALFLGSRPSAKQPFLVNYSGVLALLQAGADPFVRDAKGKDAVTLFFEAIDEDRDQSNCGGDASRDGIMDFFKNICPERVLSFALSPSDGAGMSL